jgi:putative ABC transport system permease protein
MWKNYLKISFRNLWKNKSFTFINIIGLAVGLAVAFSIFLYVVNEVTYDRFHEKSDRIYRFAASMDLQDRHFEIAEMPIPFGPALKQKFPEVKKTTRIQEAGSTLISRKNSVIKETGIYYVDPDFFKMFTVPVVSGNPEKFLDDPFEVVITEEMARKYFGEENPIGKIMEWDHTHQYTVTGVVKKMPENSHFKFNMLSSLSTLESMGRNMNDWMSFSIHTYLELGDNVQIDGLEEKYYDFLWAHIPEQIKKLVVDIDLSLQPLTRIHLYSYLEQELEPPGNLAYIRIFTAIALFILLIAGINFVNLSTARSAKRAKEVGIRKVLGAHRRRLAVQLLGESVILSMVSLAGALVLIRLWLPIFNRFIMKELTFHPFQDWSLGLGMLGMTLLVGVVAGAYPALYLSSFGPLEAVKSRFKAGRGHKFFRSGLVSLQYVISIVLICCTLIVFFQLNHVRSYDLGFDHEQMAVVYLQGQIREKNQVFKNKLLNIPGVVKAAGSTTLMGRASNETYFRFEGYPEGDKQILPHMDIDEDFLGTYNIDLKSGRNFSSEYSTDKNAVILNETLVRELGWKNPISKTVLMTEMENRKFIEVPYTVIGVISDFHFESLHQKIRGHILRYTDDFYRISVKLRPEAVPSTLKSMENVWKELETKHPFNYSFLDDTFNRFYQTEQRLGEIFMAFSLITIFIACLGLFGLASFSTEQRTKEIGIRKVLGASVSRVVILLSRDFSRWVILANVIAWPVAYIVMSRWLSRFAYRIDLSWWFFIISGMLALVIALMTVSFRTLKAATIDPADSLRYE